MNTVPNSSLNPWIVTRSLVVGALLLLAARPASGGQEQLARAIAETRKEVVATRDQLQATVNALEVLVSQKEGDLRPNFEAFGKEVAKTQANAAATKARSAKMEANAKAYFDDWQAEVDGLNSESLRGKAQKRLTNVQKSYAKATGRMSSAAKSFEPYLSDLADITRILSSDLTPGGIRAIRGTVGRAKFDLGAVRGHIAGAAKELERMEASLTTRAGN